MEQVTMTIAVDRKPWEQANDELLPVLENAFGNVLPCYGYTFRENQFELAKHILDALRNRKVSLAEAEVGTGKTLAYLLAAILTKRGRVNDLWLHTVYPKLSEVAMSKLCVVIATSSIALQNALVNKYIPELSGILVENHIIDRPLSCVLRKGKEHYVCELNLRNALLFETNANKRAKLTALLEPGANIDLGTYDNLSAYLKRKICVSGRCGAVARS